MNINLNEYHIPEIFKRNGKDCYLCRTRKRLIPCTPEETIRQRIISYLITDINVPEHLIETEVPLTRFKKGARGRADIVCYKMKNGELCEEPILLIECKSISVEITHDVFTQVNNYNKILKAKIVCISNGKELNVRYFDTIDHSYNNIESIPKFNDILDNKVNLNKSDVIKNWERTPYDKLKNKGIIERFKSRTSVYNSAQIHPKTDDKYCPTIIRLIDLIRDTSTLLIPQVLNGLNFVKDGGVRYSKYGNSSGIPLYGNYRYFIIEDSQGNHQIVSFAIYEQIDYNSTYLMVAIDDFESEHHSLELSIDKSILIEGDNVEIYHSGAMTVGNKGRKDKAVLDFMKLNAPELIKNEKIYIGKFNITNDLHINDVDIKMIIGNLVKYALLRDNLRFILKNDSV